MSEIYEQIDYTGYESPTDPVLSETESESDHVNDEMGDEDMGRGESRRSHMHSGGRRDGRRGVRVRSTARSGSQRSFALTADEEAQGWNEDLTAPPTHAFTATLGMTVSPPATQFGFFQLFVPFKLLFYFMQETNDYTEHQHVDRGKGLPYRRSGCNVIDIAHFEWKLSEI